MSFVTNCTPHKTNLNINWFSVNLNLEIYFFIALMQLFLFFFMKNNSGVLMLLLLPWPTCHKNFTIVSDMEFSGVTDNSLDAVSDRDFVGRGQTMVNNFSLFNQQFLSSYFLISHINIFWRLWTFFFWYQIALSCWGAVKIILIQTFTRCLTSLHSLLYVIPTS